MKENYNFEVFLNKQPARPQIHHSKLFQKAALIFNVDLGRDLAGFSPDEIGQFKEKAILQQDGTYGLLKDDRLNILENGIGKDNIDQAISELGVNSRFSRVLLTMANPSEELNLDKLSNEELYYAITLSDLWPESVDKNKLKRLYTRNQFFKPYERLTQNFAGREKELATLNNYVDWLPKATVLEKAVFNFRNLINWNEKNPLLIKGVGGVGKSTLVAKFILDQNARGNYEGALPFVYIDFDLPGFTIHEPMTVLLEALRQIKIQFSDHGEIIDRVSAQISELIFTNGQSSGTGLDSEMTRPQSQESTRAYIYRSIDDILQLNHYNLSQLGVKPILVVFDSFEEMQYRASSSELHRFFVFIQEISQKIPRIRPVFVGRSDLDAYVENVKFQTLGIGDFDQKSSMAFLENIGINDPGHRQIIFKNLGGNPLMLRLAGQLVKNPEFDISEVENIRGAKWRYLVNRILGHIHNDQVRKIAIPGMLVRHVNPEIIREVLAGPTGLIIENDDHVLDLFEALKKEASLITRDTDFDEFAFRQDLRMVCEDMILKKYPSESREIRDNAIRYYSTYESIEDEEIRNMHQAEYLYHRMKDGETPTELDALLYTELRPYLEQSVIEFPQHVQDFIHGLLGKRRKAAMKRTDDQSRKDWEAQHVKIIRESLVGELTFLNDECRELDRNDQFVNNGFSEFGIQTALAFQRIDQLKKSNSIIESALKFAGENPSQRHIVIELKLLRIENLEYEERYREAVDYLNRELPLIEDWEDIHFTDRLCYRYMHGLLKSRMEHRLGLTTENPELIYNEEQKYALIQAFDQKNNIRWRNFVRLSGESYPAFLTAEVFNQTFRKYRRELRDLHTLEGFTRRILKSFLNELTYTGEFNIVLRDILQMTEFTGEQNVA